jgi:hypothetical protein
LKVLLRFWTANWLCAASVPVNCDVFLLLYIWRSVHVRMNACYATAVILEIFSSKSGNFWCIFSQKSFVWVALDFFCCQVVKICPEKRILLVCLYWHLWNSIYLVSAFLLLMYVRGLWWKTFVLYHLFFGYTMCTWTFTYERQNLVLAHIIRIMWTIC